MKFIDFFAGVGGFRRGMELAGHECVGFCEFDKEKQAPAKPLMQYKLHVKRGASLMNDVM